MTEIQAWLDEGKALADKTIPGPWVAEWVEDDDWHEIHGQPFDGMVCPQVATIEGGGETEAAFIADARTRLPLALAVIQAVMEVHTPIDALNVRYRGGRLQQVCTGCGTDDGNWNQWPCPTVQAIHDAIGDHNG